MRSTTHERRSSPRPPSPSPSPSPPNLGRRTSLIDLKDWVVDDGPSKALITFNSPPKLPPRTKPPSSPPQPPPSFLYPPRSAKDSLTVEPPHLDPRSRNLPNHVPSSSISSFHSVSLSSAPSTPNSAANFPVDHSHPPLNGKHSEADSISLTESYEDVSTSSLASPATVRMITLDWDKAMAKRRPVPPKLPDRPQALVNSPPPHTVSRAASTSRSTPSSPIIKPTSSAASSPGTFVTTYAPRRTAPPPPPSRSSDRSSIQSVTTTRSVSSSSPQPRQSQITHSISLKAKRPTPVPLAARRRYESVFNANVIQRRKYKQNEKNALLTPNESRNRRAAGWRGLSVDLITTDDISTTAQIEADDTVDKLVGSDEKLEAGIVKFIWKRSGLDNARLAEIWTECDSMSQGALSLDAFAKGMWRIDEELRRAQSQAVSLGAYRSSSLRSTASSSRTSPQKPKSRDILR